MSHAGSTRGALPNDRSKSAASMVARMRRVIGVLQWDEGSC